MKLTEQILKRMIKEELTRGQQAVLDLQRQQAAQRLERDRQQAAQRLERDRQQAAQRLERDRQPSARPTRAFRSLWGHHGVIAASKKAMKNRDDHDISFLEEYVDPWDHGVSPDIFFHPYVRKQRKIVGKQIYDNCKRMTRSSDQARPHEQFDKRDQHQAEMAQIRANQRRNAQRIENLKKDNYIVDGIASGTPEAEQKIKELIKYDTELALRLQDLNDKEKENYRDFANISQQNFRDMVDSAEEVSAGHYICRKQSIVKMAFDKIFKEFEEDYIGENDREIKRYVNETD